VTIGDQILRLSFSSDQQLNAKIPYQVNTETNQQLLVQRGLAYAQIVTVNVAAAQPEIFRRGREPLITKADGSLVTLENPAKPGDAIVIYCTGLGAVDQPLEDSAMTPDSSLFSVVNPVSVTFNGVPIAPFFAGLTPKFTGLYQVNVVVPNDIKTGSVQLSIDASGQSSQTVTLLLR
jgi:uncharacterized protein (TIGR03437 family)